MGTYLLILQRAVCSPMSVKCGAIEMTAIIIIIVVVLVVVVHEAGTVPVPLCYR